ncbi:MAG TPA: hypothetical protein VHX63_05095 [Acidobacteriaceae bacterium]|jgi:hypothetical protein|nr:hypothetical protein [Acidobacteriaceae bacterium]
MADKNRATLSRGQKIFLAGLFLFALLISFTVILLVDPGSFDPGRARVTQHRTTEAISNSIAH